VNAIQNSRLLAYWKEQLSEAPGILELPTDRVRPAVPSYRGAVHCFGLSTALSEAVKDLARQEGATLFMVLLAAFQVVLSRWSGQQDVVVGTSVVGRADRQAEGLVGFFVNILALRARLSEVESFRDLIWQVKETALAAYAHQDLPFEDVAQELVPVRDLSRHPIFQVSFVLHRMANQEFEIPGLQLEGVAAEQVTAKFDLTLVLHESDEGLKGGLEYTTDLFDEATIVRFAGHLTQLLEQVVGAPQARLGQLDILSPAERHQLLEEWNATQAAYPQDCCVHELFGAQAGRTPDAVAVAYEDRALTYRQLDQQANQLAQHLRALGVGPESIVGLCVPRSLQMLVGVLGILKAGAAYLPIDPTLPPDRISFMLGDARAPILVIDSSLEEHLPAYSGRTIFLDLDWPMIARRTEQAPATGVGPDHPAYVIYTSGSTGQPKGVVVPHRGACNLAQAQQRLFGVQPAERVLQFARLSFDASVWEILMALYAGATLCLMPESGGGDLANTLAQLEVNVATLPPSVLELLQGRALPKLRTLVVAGENCPVERARAMSVGRRFVNAYGPTEATVCATALQFRTTDESIPIGRPISNVQIYVLDGRYEAVPIGVVGELYIGGVGLARGYLNRPGLTAQRFIANPFGAPGSRLYRTGDLARYHADGNVEFLGRMDHQVKIRGFRIELGEIEAALCAHPGVAQAVVIDRADDAGHRRLVGYVVGEVQDLPMAELRALLKERLPEFMIPAALVTLERFPLTRNGKLDRQALPDPDIQLSSQTDYVGPRTQSERVLAQIWAKVLNLPRVGIEEDFFELGGDSVLAMEIISCVREVFALELTLRSMFAAPTIAGFASYLDEVAQKG
jgi:amino acid adenylation domain-containing protein